MKKILTIIISIVFFNACSSIDKQYKYYPIIKNNKVHILGSVKDRYSEYSPLDTLKIEDTRNGTYTNHKIKLMDNKIKIIKDNREYTIPYSKSEDYDDIYIYKSI